MEASQGKKLGESLHSVTIFFFTISITIIPPFFSTKLKQQQSYYSHEI